MVKLLRIILVAAILISFVSCDKNIGETCTTTAECGARKCCGTATPDPTVPGNTAGDTVMVCNTKVTQDTAFSDPNDATKLYTFFCNENAI